MGCGQGFVKRSHVSPIKMGLLRRSSVACSIGSVIEAGPWPCSYGAVNTTVRLEDFVRLAVA